MSLEGVGDEVIDFFFTLTLIIIAFIAWWTTSLSERPLMQTVFIVERRTIRRSHSDLQRSSTFDETRDTSPEGEQLVTESNSQSDSDTRPTLKVNPKRLDGRDVLNNRSSDANGEDINEDVVSEPIDEGSTSDNDQQSILRNRRLALFDLEQDDSIDFEPDEFEGHEFEANEYEPNDFEANGYDGSGYEANEFENTDAANMAEDETGEGNEDEEADDGRINIRLKYLNDDLKVVDGKLQEQLGDFKRRHFSVELSGQKVVRLIFKGHVLQEDTKTLQNCGLFDNCVVHCLVHSRSPPPSPNMSRINEARGFTDYIFNFDIGNMLFVGLSILLGLAWYGRFHYAQLYTATTTVTLVGLTGIFTVSLIGMYLPDTDGLRD